MSPVANAQSSRATITEAVKARLEAVPGLSVYVGEVPNLPPLVPGRTSTAGRVAPYAAIFPSPGALDPNPNLAGTPGDFVWGAQITFAAGVPETLEATLDAAVPLLNLWTPEIEGLDVGKLRPPAGFYGGQDAGAMRRDDKFTPPRYWAPTLWRLHVTTA